MVVTKAVCTGHGLQRGTHGQHEQSAAHADAAAWNGSAAHGRRLSR